MTCTATIIAGLTAENESLKSRIFELECKLNKAEIERGWAICEHKKVLAKLESQKPVGYFCRHPVLGFYEEQIGPSDSNIALYAQPVPAPTQVPAKPIIDKPTLPPGWQVSRVPDAEFQPRHQIYISKIGADGRAERGGTACRLDDSSLFWHFFNDWLLVQKSAG